MKEFEVKDELLNKIKTALYYIKLINITVVALLSIGTALILLSFLLIFVRREHKVRTKRELPGTKLLIRILRDKERSIKNLQENIASH